MASLSACGGQSETPKSPDLCTASWYESVEQAITSGDDMGHGPDIGSEEWKSVIEFKLGVRGNADLPDHASDDWCSYIAELLQGSKDR